jgi:hypothetical protein
MARETRDETHRDPSLDDRSPAAGVVLVFSDGPKLMAATFDEDGKVRIGRDDPLGSLLTDERLSRHHAEIVCSREGAYTVRDLGSRNGTAANGQNAPGETKIRAGAIIRTGGTVVLVLDDVRPFLGASVELRGDVVCGPRLAAVLDAASGARDPLCLTGETGSGKEVAARAFHAGRGPFVAVNCATIQEGLAERILFGAKKGAFSGATTDAGGLVQSADGGVLFLDEVDELAPSVQAKLLRVLETNEVLALGATNVQKVAVRFCFAAQGDLRADPARFRQDLWYRLRTHITVPPLRDRPEEIPHLVHRELASRRLTAHAKLIETCLLRPWPGNVRELLAEVRVAGDAAAVEKSDVVRAEHLRPAAGMPADTKRTFTREDVERALAAASGNISEAARSLGLHRTQLKRTMQKLGL